MTLYETTQGVSATQKGIASVLNILQENVRVISKYLGGGFGCKALLRSHTILAAIAARQVKRLYMGNRYGADGENCNGY